MTGLINKLYNLLVNPIGNHRCYVFSLITLPTDTIVASAELYVT
jgi:hypothetical protein